MAEGGKWFENEHSTLTILGKSIKKEDAEKFCDQLMENLENKLPEEAKVLLNKLKGYITTLLTEIRRSSRIIRSMQTSLEETANKTLMEDFNVTLNEEDITNYADGYEWKHILSNELWQSTMKAIKDEVMKHGDHDESEMDEEHLYTTRDHHGTTLYKEKMIKERPGDYIKLLVEEWIRSYDPEMENVIETTRKTTRLPEREVSPISVDSQAQLTKDEDDRDSIDLDPMKSWEKSRKKTIEEGKPFGYEIERDKDND